MAPITKLLVGIGVVIGGLVTLLWLDFWFLTGSPIPRWHVEKLNNPIKVTGWTADGLLLADGRKVMPKGLTELPLESKALRHLTKGGVEVAPDGTVTGLVTHIRTCGNDACIKRVTRVDVGSILAYFHIAKSDMADLPQRKPDSPLYDFEDGIGRPFSGYSLWLKRRTAVAETVMLMGSDAR